MTTLLRVALILTRQVPWRKTAATPRGNRLFSSIFYGFLKNKTGIVAKLREGHGDRYGKRRQAVDGISRKESQSAAEIAASRDQQVSVD
jgi:hypothetical protein